MRQISSVEVLRHVLELKRADAREDEPDPVLPSCQHKFPVDEVSPYSRHHPCDDVVRRTRLVFLESKDRVS